METLTKYIEIGHCKFTIQVLDDDAGLLIHATNTKTVNTWQAIISKSENTKSIMLLYQTIINMPLSRFPDLLNNIEYIIIEGMMNIPLKKIENNDKARIDIIISKYNRKCKKLKDRINILEEQSNLLKDVPNALSGIMRFLNDINISKPKSGPFSKKNVVEPQK